MKENFLSLCKNFWRDFGEGACGLTIGRVMTFVIVSMSVLATVILPDGLAITSVFWVSLVTST